jgi:hypothetical protein
MSSDSFAAHFLGDLNFKKLNHFSAEYFQTRESAQLNAAAARHGARFKARRTS